MENKYYTPEIEEFHVGFEFEQNENGNWVKCVLQDSECEMVFSMLSCYPDEKWRVKHLDKEDIESLGWKFISERYKKYFKLNENYSLYLEPEYKKNVTIIYTNDWGDESRPIFSGTIKNKSELRKLIHQLNINSGGN